MRIPPLILVLVLLAACPLGHDESRPYRCFSDKDCFQQQGEVCQKPPGAKLDEPGECRARIDAGIPDLRIHDLYPSPDLSPDQAGDLSGDLSDALVDGPDAAPNDLLVEN